MPEALAPAAPVAPVAPAAPSAPAPAAPAESGAAPVQNTAVEAPAAAPEGVKPDTDQDPEKQRGTRRFERRLDKAYRRAAEAQARADLLEKQIAELKPKEQPDPGAPRLESFKDIEEYADAKAKYEADKAVKKVDTERQTKAQREHEQQLTASWESKAARADSKYEDFDEVVGELKPTTPMFAAIMDAENGEDIAYHLGKNLKEAQAILALPPLSQARAIGRLEAKLAAEPATPKTPSKAPAPITPLTGTAPVATDVPTEKDDMRDWMRKRQKQVHGKRA